MGECVYVCAREKARVGKRDIERKREREGEEEGERVCVRHRHGWRQIGIHTYINLYT